jgi:hypothetical protein
MKNAATVVKTRWRTRVAPTPTLRFTPTAWANLLFLRDFGNSEVGGFGVAAEDDPLLIEDFRLVRQTCSVITVKFDDEAVADFFDEQVDAGRKPESFFRVWIHTHPGDCAQPSGVDEATFARVFGSADWAIMFIIAEGGETFARLRFNVGPNAEMLIPVEVDYSQPFAGSDYAAWTAEYEANVNEEATRPLRKVAPLLSEEDPFAMDDEEVVAEWKDSWWDYVDESASALEVL